MTSCADMPFVTDMLGQNAKSAQSIQAATHLPRFQYIYNMFILRLGLFLTSHTWLIKCNRLAGSGDKCANSAQQM